VVEGSCRHLSRWCPARCLRLFVFPTETRRRVDRRPNCPRHSRFGLPRFESIRIVGLLRVSRRPSPWGHLLMVIEVSGGFTANTAKRGTDGSVGVLLQKWLVRSSTLAARIDHTIPPEKSIKAPQPTGRWEGVRVHRDSRVRLAVTPHDGLIR